MKNNYTKYIGLVLSVGILCSCHESAPTRAEDASPRVNTLSKEEARNLFYQKQTRTNTGEGLFALGTTEPDWEQAEESANEEISCVDVPLTAQHTYLINRISPDNTSYAVRAWPKLTVVKSAQTGAAEPYLHFFIPDPDYAAMYDCDISQFFSNCQDRDDYSGLELYTTLDGTPAAAATYENGEVVATAFLYNPKFSFRDNSRRLAFLSGTIFLQKQGDTATTRREEPNKDWWDPMGRTLFVGSDGILYLVTARDDGSYALNMICYWIDKGNGVPGSSSTLGGGSGSNPFPDIPPDLPYGGDGSGTTPGGGGGTAPGGGDIPGPPSTPGGDIIVSDWKPNPLPWPQDDLIPILPKTSPCEDLVKGLANPLLSMKIADNNRSWVSNTWGYVRKDDFQQPKFHDGLDLLGEAGVTPVFSMYDGKVVRVVTGQPNRNRKGYPSGYTGDNNGAGNRITIESTLPGGRKIQVSYWHLDIKSKNPYTQTFRVGDAVKRGQKIGIIGKTGNAYDSPPHLHLKTYIVGTKKDNSINNPTLYLYTKFDPTSGEVVHDC